MWAKGSMRGFDIEPHHVADFRFPVEALAREYSTSLKSGTTFGVVGRFDVTSGICGHGRPIIRRREDFLKFDGFNKLFGPV